MAEKIDAFGNLNSAAEAVKRAKGILSTLWDEGSIRLKDEEIKEIESIVRLITSESSEIKGILKNRFGKIANSSFEEEEK
jgi:hypothetical protein